MFFNMTKILLIIIACVSLPIYASWKDTVDYVGETFNVSVSKENYLNESTSDDLTYTLYGSHDFNETWRVFGQVDTDNFWEIGAGYSFIFSDFVYNEVTVTAGGNKDDVDVYSAGLFSALSLGELILFTDFSTQYIDRVLERPLSRLEVINFEKTFGGYHEMNEWLSLSLSYTHKLTLYKKLSIDTASKWGTVYGDKSYTHYVSPGVTFSLMGVKPTVSYNYYFDDNKSNSLDFTLTFDF